MRVTQNMKNTNINANIDEKDGEVAYRFTFALYYNFKIFYKNREEDCTSFITILS